MIPFEAGLTDQTIDIFIQDDAGAPATGLAYNTSGLTCYYRKGATGSATQLSLATQTVGGAHSDGGFVEIHATNMPGVYRLDLSDTIIAAEGHVTIYVTGTGLSPSVARLIVGPNLFGHRGTAQAGAAGTITLASTANANNDFYQYATVHITGGTGAGQTRQIASYNGTTKVATVDVNWTTNPDNTSTYRVIGRIV